jgi:hypothetical protein
VWALNDEGSFENIEALFNTLHCKPTGIYDVVIPSIANLPAGEAQISESLYSNMEKSGQRGQLRIGLPGFFWDVLTSKLKLTVSVQDRAFHKSNVIETPVLSFR